MKQFKKMKRWTKTTMILSVVVFFGLVILIMFAEEKVTDAISVEKVIMTKDSPIENRFSSIDYVWGEGSVTKSITVYYFFAEDGTCVEVEPGVYHTKNPGDTHWGPWQKKVRTY